MGSRKATGTARVAVTVIYSVAASSALRRLAYPTSAASTGQHAAGVAPEHMVPIGVLNSRTHASPRWLMQQNTYRGSSCKCTRTRTGCVSSKHVPSIRRTAVSDRRGTVASVRPFGVFVRSRTLPRDGLVHASQIDDQIELSRDDPDDAKIQALTWAAQPGSQVWYAAVWGMGAMQVLPCLFEHWIT